MGMWNVDFENLEKVNTPKDLVQKECSELYSMSNKILIARICEYDGGNYKTYVRPSFVEIARLGLPIGAEETVRPELGENSEDSTFVYELYLTSANTPKYKYRICFLYYGISMYPVGITLDCDIADELKMASEFEVEDEKTFVDTLNNILGSKKVSSVIKNLYSLN